MIYSLSYTDKMLDNRSGQTCFWFIKVRPRCKDDIGLLEHEKTHVWQFWRTCGLFCILYAFRRFRLKYEVEAYQEQLQYPPAVSGDVAYYRQKYAEFIADPNRYGLDITAEEAEKLLCG